MEIGKFGVCQSVNVCKSEYGLDPVSGKICFDLGPHGT